MTPDQKFQHTVHLYRKLNRPELSGPGFEGRAIVDQELQSHIQQIWKNQVKHSNIVGEFEELEVAGNIFESYEECPELPLGESVRIVFNLPGGDGRFYSDIQEYIAAAPSLSSGQPNPNVYLVKEDYLAGEEDKPEAFQKLEAAWRLIVLLKELSHFNSADTKTNELLIGFLIKGSSQDLLDPFHLSSEFSADILNYEEVDLHLLEEILNESGSLKAHAAEKKNIFRVSLVEVLRKGIGSRKSIDDAVAHWQDINECYEKNFETYISGFSFSKACQELAAKQVELSQNLSKALHDISGKLLGIPVSLVAVGGVLTTTDIWIAALGVLGTLLLSIFLALTLDNQYRFFAMTKDSVALSLESYHSNEHAESLNKELDRVTENLDQQISQIANHFLIYRFSIWIPAVLSIMIFYFKFI